MTFDWLAPIPLVIPLLAAAIVVGAAPLLNEQRAGGLAIAAAIATTVVCAALLLQSSQGLDVYWFGGWQPRGGIALGIAFAIDPLGAGAALLAATLVTLALVYAWSYFEEIGTLFYALMLVFLAAMVGFCLTGDLFNLFVFFELMSVAAYALTGYKVEEKGPIQGALNFAVCNSLGAFLVLYGIGLLYGRTGALNLAQIGRALSGQPADGLVVASFVLISVGLSVKAALVPFHFWLADAHAVAPTPVCVLFSGIMVEIGLYGLLRVYWTVFAEVLGPHATGIQAVLLGAGALTAVLGGIMCYLQRHLKRLLAYSTVSHAGAFVFGAASLSPLGLAGTAVYVLGHGLIKGALFMVAGILLYRFGSVDELDLVGRGRGLQGAALIFGLGGLALAGMPPFLTWIGKATIEDSASPVTAPLVVGVLVVSSILTGGAVLRATGRVFFGFGRDQQDIARQALTTGQEERESASSGQAHMPWTMLAPAVLLVVAALALGVVQTPLDRVESATMRFTDAAGYAAAVLDGQPQAVHPTADPLHASGSGVVWGLVSTLGALGLAGVSLGLIRLPRSIGLVTSTWVGALARPLRRVHSGHLGDYAAWLLIGAASFGAAYAAVLH